MTLLTYNSLYSPGASIAVSRRFRSVVDFVLPNHYTKGDCALISCVHTDGVAPRAKMNQQRSRRFRSAKEAKEKDEDKEELLKMLRSQNGGFLKEGTEEMMRKKTWDSNTITPGTPFMHILAACLRYWCAYKINTDPAWEKVINEVICRNKR